MDNIPAAKPSKKDAMASKKIETRITNLNRKTIDTPLNVWVKSLPLAKKRLFYNKLFANTQLWGYETIDKSVKLRRWNNYRYKGVGNPHYFDAIIIYCTAKHIEPGLKFEVVFPDIPFETVEKFIPNALKISLETDNFSTIQAKYA